jgi:very-short-patch-repair endonuclease
MNSNEKFIHHHTKTSHKRMEAMVIYALHYALRDVKILSQYYVQTECKKTFFIDAYFPDIKLAIEVDEPYHDQQKETDSEREKEIKKMLDCTFLRVHHRSSIYEQVDQIVNLVKEKIKLQGVKPWEYKLKALQGNSGEYTEENLNKLKDAGIPELMSVFSSELEEEGFELSEKPNSRGIPSPGNGEHGFLAKHSQIEFAIFARASGIINIRVMDFDDSLKVPIAKYLLARQTKNDNPPRYYAIAKNNGNSFKDKNEAKKALYDFLEALRFDLDNN